MIHISGYHSIQASWRDGAFTKIWRRYDKQDKYGVREFVFQCLVCWTCAI